jgi:3-oxoacyl-[acyl-carrier-protein] synthase II
MAGACGAAVTGIGVLSPLGGQGDGWFDRLCHGDSAGAPVQAFDAADSPVRFACEVPGFDPAAHLGAKDARRLDRFAQLAVVAAAAALDDAGSPAVDPERAAVVAGSGFGGIGSLDREITLGIKRGRTNPLLIPMLMPNASAALIAMRLGWRGPNLSIGTACASGGHALGEGLRVLRTGDADIVLAGAAEAPITPLVMSAFASIGGLSMRNDEPARASRPFDRDRDGFVLGEGAAFCVLEPLERARARGARVYAVLQGYGRNTDAHHIVMPDPDGRGARHCMEQALDDAGVERQSVGCVSAHGTSTPQNDAAEAKAIEDLFGDEQPAVTALKGGIGHLVGAAGALGAAAACLSLTRRTIPPVANFDKGDEGSRLDLVVDGPRPLSKPAVVANAFAFGGHNASLVFVGA